MDENTLKRAQEIKAQIDKLGIIENAYKTSKSWKNIRPLYVDVQPPGFFCSYTLQGGSISVRLPASLNDKILELLKEYKAELEKEFDRL